jgi:hypothetical protein
MSDQDSGDGKRSRLEGVIPDLLKRAVEKGVEKATGAPGDLKEFLHDLKLPKEIAHYLFTQVDETKNGLFRVVAKEMRDFLEQTNIAGDVQKVLTTVQFEINTTIRFTPNDGSAAATKEKEKERNDGEGRRDSRAPRSSSAPSARQAEGEAGERGAHEGGGDAPEDRKDGDKSTPLPKPEVRTEMYVKRDDSRRERARRGQE